MRFIRPVSLLAALAALSSCAHAPTHWLEDPGAAPARKWLEDQRKATAAFAAASDGLAILEARIGKAATFASMSVPIFAGDRAFFTYDDGAQDLPTLCYQRPGLDSKPVVFVDPKEFSPKATLYRFVTSPKGRYVAYGIKISGSDWNTWRVREVATGKDLPDILEGIKWDSPSWADDEKGLYVGRYPRKYWDSAIGSLDHALFYHRLGGNTAEDVLIFKPEDPHQVTFATPVEDGKHLLVNVIKSSDDMRKVALYDITASPEGKLVRWIVPAFDRQLSYLGYAGSKLYYWTRAPLGSIVVLDYAGSTEGRWETVIPEERVPLESAALIGKTLLVTRLIDAETAVTMHELSGKMIGPLQAPAHSTIGGLGRARQDARTAYFEVENFSRPSTVFTFDPRTRKVSKFFEPKLSHDPGALSTEILHVGTGGFQLPVHVTRAKRAGKGPGTILYAYGCYGYSEGPFFWAQNIPWFEQGGTFALAAIRGGGELGETFHQSAVREKKQASIDDFIAVAEELRRRRPGEPVIAYGGSCGGLLVVAAAVQRPDLFGAVIANYGIYDLLRYHLFSGAALWLDELGDPDKPVERAALLKLSPLENLKAGTPYPPIFFYTGLNDLRVVPSHSFKMVEALQRAFPAGHYILRTEPDAGHGTGLTRAQSIRLSAERMAFLKAVLPAR